MSLVRGTALSGLPELVRELGGDPAALFRSAGIDAADVGRHDAFVPLQRATTAVELAAAVTAVPDLGRRLAERQGIDILGPVGVAARTAPTVAEALKVLENFLAAYTPGLAVRLFDTEDPELVFFGLEFVDIDAATIPQSVELALAVTLRILRLLIGAGFHPAAVHLPHEPLTAIADYRHSYGRTPVFLAAAPGFTLAKSHLAQPLRQDRLAHEAVVSYLNSITDRNDTARHSVEVLVNQLLPTGTVTLPSIAEHLSMHPKTLQRRLADEGATFGEIVDTIRRERARRLLSGTAITLSHLARELGYAEQSVLTRSCKRWFGCGPAEYRNSCR